MKTLKLRLFGNQSCQIFMGSKDGPQKVLRYNTKSVKSGSVVPKCKLEMAEQLYRINRHWPKIGLNV